MTETNGRRKKQEKQNRKVTIAVCAVRLNNYPKNSKLRGYKRSEGFLQAPFSCALKKQICTPVCFARDFSSAHHENLGILLIKPPHSWNIFPLFLETW